MQHRRCRRPMGSCRPRALVDRRTRRFEHSLAHVLGHLPSSMVTQPSTEATAPVNARRKSLRGILGPADPFPFPHDPTPRWVEARGAGALHWPSTHAPSEARERAPFARSPRCEGRSQHGPGGSVSSPDDHALAPRRGEAPGGPLVIDLQGVLADLWSPCRPPERRARCRAERGGGLPLPHIAERAAAALDARRNARLRALDGALLGARALLPHPPRRRDSDARPLEACA